MFITNQEFVFEIFSPENQMQEDNSIYQKLIQYWNENYKSKIIFKDFSTINGFINLFLTPKAILNDAIYFLHSSQFGILELPFSDYNIVIQNQAIFGSKFYICKINQDKQNQALQVQQYEAYYQIINNIQYFQYSLNLTNPELNSFMQNEFRKQKVQFFQSQILLNILRSENIILSQKQKENYQNAQNQSGLNGLNGLNGVNGVNGLNGVNQNAIIQNTQHQMMHSNLQGQNFQPQHPRDSQNYRFNNQQNPNPQHYSYQGNLQKRY